MELGIGKGIILLRILLSGAESPMLSVIVGGGCACSGVVSAIGSLVCSVQLIRQRRPGWLLSGSDAGTQAYRRPARCNAAVYATAIPGIPVMRGQKCSLLEFRAHGIKGIYGRKSC